MDRMPEVRLQKYLEQLGCSNAKVFSLGCEGYGQDQQLFALQEYFDDKKFRADLVVLWQTPYNDVWENMLPNQWTEASMSKPTFALVDGKLVAPNHQHIGQPLLSSFKVAASIQFILDEQFKLNTSDLEWEEKYLPPAYKPIVWTGPVVLKWQDAWDVEFAWMRYENFANEKSNFAIGLTPPSPRMNYAIELTNKLLHRIKGQVENHHGRFVSFMSEPSRVAFGVKPCMSSPMSTN